MNTEKQIKALAELGGYCFCRSEQSGGVEEWHDGDGELVFNLPKYLTSYDCIIPLIQKLCNEEIDITDLELYMLEFNVVRSTPSQLCEALLRATGKWEE